MSTEPTQKPKEGMTEIEQGNTQQMDKMLIERHTECQYQAALVEFREAFPDFGSDGVVHDDGSVTLCEIPLFGETFELECSSRQSATDFLKIIAACYKISFPGVATFPYALALYREQHPTAVAITQPNGRIQFFPDGIPNGFREFKTQDDAIRFLQDAPESETEEAEADGGAL